MTSTRAVLPVPCGRLTVPRTIWSALRGSTPSRNPTSTVASNLVGEVSLASLTASAGLYRASLSILASALRYALLRFMSDLLGGVRGPGRAWPSHGNGNSAGDVDAHGAGGTGDDLLGLLDRAGV